MLFADRLCAFAQAARQEAAMSTVMIVDDADLARATLGRLLEREGYRTVQARNGREALGRLRKQREPDLIVLDLNMPDIDGLELLEILHDHPRWQSIPVIMLTAVSDTHSVHRAEQLGAKRYLVKATFSIREMLNQVRRYIAQPR
jgi:CheY-like chemotaxis protein